MAFDDAAEPHQSANNAHDVIASLVEVIAAYTSEGRI